MSKARGSISRPAGVIAITIINGFGGVLTLLFWGLVYVRLFRGAPITDPVLRVSSATTLGFLVGDILWTVPLLFLSCWGLWRLRDWGWLFAQMVNILWIYSMTVLWLRDTYIGTISPGALLFSPFTLVAVWASVYLWKRRDCFRPSNDGYSIR